MKHYLFIAAYFLVANSFKANALIISTIVEQPINQIIYVSVKITSNNKPVEGALVKIRSQKSESGFYFFLHERKSGQDGIAKFRIIDHTNPTVNIEISHPLYKTQTIKAITLKQGHIVYINLKAKGTTVDAALKENYEETTYKETSTGKEYQKITKRKEKAVIDQHRPKNIRKKRNLIIR